MGDDIFDIYCNMAVAPSEKDTCGVGGWTLVMKIDGKKVYVLLYAHMIIFKEYANMNNKYMLFTGWEVRIGKNCARGVEYRPRP